MTRTGLSISTERRRRRTAVVDAAHDPHRHQRFCRQCGTPPPCFALFWHALDIIWVWLFTVVYLMGVAMTETRYDRAPGDSSAFFEQEASDWVIYTIGLVLAVILTAISFWVAEYVAALATRIALGLTVLAIARWEFTWSFSWTSQPGPTTPTTC